MAYNPFANAGLTPKKEIQYLKHEKEPLPDLCEEQEEAIRAIVGNRDKRIFLLTGCAGSGKSVLIKTMMRRHSDLFSICSTTARSARAVKGVVVDSMFSIDRKFWKFRNYARMKDNMRSRTNEYIIIDEASMVGSSMADLIEEAITYGNKGLVLCGDWAQAAPVKDSWPFRSPLFMHVEPVFLRECHRQEDPEFLGILNDVRQGLVSARVDRFMREHTGEFEDREGVVRLYATNKLVKAYNLTCLEEHRRNNPRAKSVTVSASLFDEREDHLKKKYPVTLQQISRYIDSSPVADNEEFIEGCPVVVTKNILDGMGGYTAVNGDAARFEEIDKNGDFVLYIYRTKAKVTVGEARIDHFTSPTQTDAPYVVVGYPITLGYSMTIHKAQGMSLDRVEVHTSSVLHFPEQSQQHGLTYVGVSRARTPEGLRLLDWAPQSIHVDEQLKRLIVDSSPRVVT